MFDNILFTFKLYLMKQLSKFLLALSLLMVAVCLTLVAGCDSNLSDKPEVQEAPRSLKREGKPHHVVNGESVADAVSKNKHSFYHYTVDAWENSFEDNGVGSDTTVFETESPDGRGFRQDYEIRD